ncbi:MAG: hypothetical protein LBI84_04360 [Propionibacteriaceae bacterium]|jgi:L-amino acid N-acyltransferase YncA|nr:hypothetical protein [Propionibacteriaceae bacterium]
MAVVIRDIDLERDSEQVADLYRRTGYGAAVGNGISLTGEAFRAMMKLNDMRVVLVADEDGRVVGIQGALAIDACRAAPPGHLWGNHLVVDPAARGSIVMGALFAEMFTRLLALGTGSLHARVNPKNRPALRLDVRSGFRVIGSDRPDADSFIELISHVPGVMAAARTVAVDPETGAVWLPKFTVASLRGGRGQDMFDGVRRDGGRVELTYAYEAKNLAGEIVVDGWSGKILRLSANGEDHTDEFLATQASVPEADPAASSHRFHGLAPRRCGPFTCSIDALGRLRIDHPGQLGPVLLDCFPDGAGHTVAYRRPPFLDLQAAETADGWRLRAADGTEREIAVRDDGVHVVCRAPAGAVPGALAVHPRVGLRTAEYAVAAASPDGPSFAGPLRPGRWPPQLPAYEAAGDADWSVPALGAVSRWEDEAAGLSVAIEWGSPGRLRCEGECRAEGPALAYRLRLASRASVPADLALGNADPENAGPESQASEALAAALAACPVRPWNELIWGRSDHRRLTGASRGCELTVSPETGLVEWKAGGRTILKHGSGDRGFGAMAAVPSALWPSLDSDRADVDRGPEWGGLDSRFVFLEQGELADPAAAGWSIGANGDFTSLVLTTSIPAVYAGLDAVFNLKPSAAVTSLAMADSAGRLTEVSCRDDGVERPWGLWWGFSRHVVIPLGGGRSLDLAPLSGAGTEILVRSVTAGFLVSLLSRVVPAGPSVAHWAVRLVPSPVFHGNSNLTNRTNA